MTTTFALDCPICLDKLHDPVVTPCGHLGCDACIKAHARGSSDPYKTTCPTCRAPLPLVTPDLTIVPSNYHAFISPSLRRVYLDDAEAETNSKSRAAINNLKTEIATLKGRVASLKRYNGLYMDRYQVAENTVAALRFNERNLERNLRLALDEKQNPKRFRAEYDAVKSLFFLLCEVVLEIITWSVASGRQ